MLELGILTFCDTWSPFLMGKEKEIAVNEIIVTEPNETQIPGQVVDWADLTDVERTANEDCKDCD